MKNLPIIPIMLCFNDNYVIPAGVAIYSMLINFSKDYHYDIYILHSDITEIHQKKLVENVKDFSNVSLNFMDMGNRFEDLYGKTSRKAHWSKEIYYKFIPAEIFPQYDKIIITDVDVVFERDFSKIYEEFDVNEEYYLAASIQIYHKDFYNSAIPVLSEYFKSEEIDKIWFAGGLYIYNLKKIREDNIIHKFINYAQKNLNRLRCPEQEVISLVCYPKIKKLPVNSLVSTMSYDMFDRHDYDNAMWYSESEVIYAFENPIQLHYAGPLKPWNIPTITKADIWYRYLASTNFYIEQMDKFMLKPKNPKRFFRLQSKKFHKKITCLMEDI